MKRQSGITPEIEKILRTEAQLRAQETELKGRRLTNKQLADQTGFSPLYIAQLVARYRREIEMHLTVPRETSTS